MEIDVKIRKCRNGYYIRIFDGYWQIIPKRHVAQSSEEMSLILEPYLEKLEP